MSALNLLVFREGRKTVSGTELRSRLVEELLCSGSRPTEEQLMRTLLLAGELECGVADAGSDCAFFIETITDHLAQALRLSCSPNSQPFHGTYFSANSEKLLVDLREQSIPETLTVSTPEGFAYYGLHPLAYAERVTEIENCANDLAVIGIRSIGTTLSAVVTAAARIRGMQAKRITVRPQGHPYNRVAEFTAEQQEFIRSAVSRNATFVIVDEGPGLSGSSFLAVAEAAEAAGASREKIVLLCGHEPNADALCTMDGARRWKRFRSLAVANGPLLPMGAEIFIGGGEWRRKHFTSEHEWPAAWTSFERLKYLTAGHPARMFKFVGIGHYGDQVFERESKVAEAEFGPLPRKEVHGFISYPWINGHPMRAAELSPSVIARLAEYCAYRVQAFVERQMDISPLQQMAEHNLHELKINLPMALRVKRPVIADGKMQPYEWILNKEGQMLKTDSGSHGDDHFFSGATDIAWDLAGAIIEWRMNGEQKKKFLDLYCSISGDDAQGRINDYICAYAVFRSAYCLMAANAMNGSDEQVRLEKASAEYQALLSDTEAVGASTA
ncbi:MAG TPA: hypothetical protein VFB79_21305 [Candidatus Angelobacter sp.]|nr:hypothetical protein [Candidatus Angelobacter sp.]